MSDDEFSSVLSAIEGRAEYLYFHIMGEPLLHPSVRKFASLAKRRGFRVMITTNGLLHEVGRELVSDGNVYRIGISVHSFEGNRYSLTEEELSTLKKQAAHGYIMDVENRQLKQQLATAKQDCAEWQTRYRDLRNDVQPYLEALRHAPERVRNFFENLLPRKPERTANIPKDRHHKQNVEL